jgi:uncharacterized membrane protein YidH (DUF202 family)
MVLLLIASAAGLSKQSIFLMTFPPTVEFARFIDQFILFPCIAFILAQTWSIYKFYKKEKTSSKSVYLFLPAISMYVCLRLLIIGLFYLSHNIVEIDALTFVDKFRLFLII